MYLQTDFPDVAFVGQNLSVAGCFAVAFTMAASGFDRNITVWDGAKLTTARSFTGIIFALNSKGMHILDLFIIILTIIIILLMVNLVLKLWLNKFVNI